MNVNISTEQWVWAKKGNLEAKEQVTTLYIYKAKKVAIVTKKMKNKKPKTTPEQTKNQIKYPKQKTQTKPRPKKSPII